MLNVSQKSKTYKSKSSSPNSRQAIGAAFPYHTYISNSMQATGAAFPYHTYISNSMQATGVIIII